MSALFELAVTNPGLVFGLFLVAIVAVVAALAILLHGLSTLLNGWPEPSEGVRYATVQEQILRLIECGQIDAEEAIQLLVAVEASATRDAVLDDGAYTSFVKSQPAEVQEWLDKARQEMAKVRQELAKDREEMFKVRKEMAGKPAAQAARPPSQGCDHV